jgi:antitoxin component YwqK of YwqJK toxin-antitoxin module
MGRYCEKCGKRKASSRCDQCGFIDYYNGTSLYRYLRSRFARNQLRSLVYGGKCNPGEIEHSKPWTKQSFHSAPDCPDCGELMALRTAKRGIHIGKKFWGCRSFPDCREILEYKEKERTEKKGNLTDQKDEVYNEWYENGRKKLEGKYKDGKADGVWTYWYENGQKQAEISYKEGKKDGIATGWGENGEKEVELNYRHGKKNGIGTRWGASGQTAVKVSYRDGKKDGIATGWYESGQKKNEENWKNGEQDGLETWWHENGQKLSEENYKDGECISEIIWYKNGRKKLESYKGRFETWWYENGQKEIEEDYEDKVFIHYNEDGTERGRQKL